MIAFRKLMESDSDSDSDSSFSKYDNKRAMMLQDIELQNCSGSSPIRPSHPEVVESIPRSFKSLLKGESLLLVLNFLVMILIPLFVLDLTTVTSCREGSLMCFPQYKLHIVENTPKARSTLLSLRLGLKMISFMAGDMGISEMVSSDATIDTFSSQNVFSLNNRGFCRMNTETGDDYCVDANGLDVFSSLVTDIGIQLGNINPQQDSKAMGKSLDKSITLIVDLFETLYDKALGDKEEENALKMQQLTTAHKINSLKNFGNILAVAPFYSLALCVLMLIALSITRFLGKHSYSNWTTGIIGLLVFLHFAVILSRFCTQLITHFRVSRSTKSFEIIKLQHSSGSLLLGIILVLDVISLVGLTNAFMKKKN